MRVFILLLPLTFFISSVFAQDLEVTHTFSNTTIADADQVNQNFSDIETWINTYFIVGEYADGNTALGDGALRDFVYGLAASNTGIGYQALHGNTSGAQNTASGSKALYSNTTGYQNTAIGHRALEGNTTGYANTAIGIYADVLDGDLSNATAIGHAAVVDSSNKIQLGDTDVTSVSTAGALTTGAVTYPNEDGFSGQVLATNGSGVVDWVDGLPEGCSDGQVAKWNVFLGRWLCSSDQIAARAEEFEEQVASLQKQLQIQKEELLAVVQLQQEQMSAQQEQIAQLQRMVEHQFAAR